MNWMHRTGMLLAAGVLLAASGCKREPTNQRVDAAIAPLLPADTLALAGLRLDRLKNTPFFRQYVEGKKLPMLETFREKTGLDPTKDIWELVWSVSPNRTLMFIRGKFGGEFGLEPKFDVPGVLKMNYKTYYVLYQGEAGVMFLNSGVAVAGKLDDLKALIDNRDKKGESAPQELIDMVKELPADHMYVVSRQAGALVPSMPTEGTAGNFARLATTVGELRMHADLKAGVNLAVTAQYPEEQLAQQARDVLRGVLGMVRLRTKSDQGEMLKALDAVTVQSRGKSLEISVQTPFELIDQMLKSLPIFSGRAGESPRRD